MIRIFGHFQYFVVVVVVVVVVAVGGGGGGVKNHLGHFQYVVVVVVVGVGVVQKPLQPFAWFFRYIHTYFKEIVMSQKINESQSLNTDKAMGKQLFNISVPTYSFKSKLYNRRINCFSAITTSMKVIFLTKGPSTYSA
jgi:hypothetical protein